MSIRTFISQDLEQVVALANRCALFDSEVTEADFQSAHLFPEGLLVAPDGDEIVGFVFAYLRDIPGEVLSRWGAYQVAQIELLAVTPSHRRKGIAKALLNNLFDNLREVGVDLILLHCPVEAEAAKSLYDQLGFEVRAYAMKKHL